MFGNPAESQILSALMAGQLSSSSNIGINSPYKSYTRLVRNTRSGGGRGKAKNRVHNVTKRRNIKGSLQNDMVESRNKVDLDGKPVMVYRYDQLDSNGNSLTKGKGISIEQ